MSQSCKVEVGGDLGYTVGKPGNATSREKDGTMRPERAECRRSWGPRDSKAPMRYRKQQLLFPFSILGSSLQCGLHIRIPLLPAHPFISWLPSCLQLGEMNSTPVSCGMARHFLYLCTASKWPQCHFPHVGTAVLAVCLRSPSRAH